MLRQAMLNVLSSVSINCFRCRACNMTHPVVVNLAWTFTELSHLKIKHRFPLALNFVISLLINLHSDGWMMSTSFDKEIWLPIIEKIHHHHYHHHYHHHHHYYHYHHQHGHHHDCHHDEPVASAGTHESHQIMLTDEASPIPSSSSSPSPSWTSRSSSSSASCKSLSGKKKRSYVWSKISSIIWFFPISRYYKRVAVENNFPFFHLSKPLTNMLFDCLTCLQCCQLLSEVT